MSCEVNVNRTFAIHNHMQPVKWVMVTALRRRTREYELSLPASWWHILMRTLSIGTRWRSHRSDSNMPLLRGEINIAESVDYFITFGSRDGEIELRVPEDIFMNVLDGESGLLTYQGEIFRGFIKDRTSSQGPNAFDPDKTQRL